MRQSKISYCDYSGGNLNWVKRGYVRGECETGPGCAHCYVLRLHDRLRFLPERTTFYPKHLADMAMTKFATPAPVRGKGKRPILFHCDTGDWLHDRITDAQVELAIDTLAEREDCIHLLFTKRINRLCALSLTWPRLKCGWPENIWPVISICTQQEAMTYLPSYFSIVKASVLGVSFEPLLTDINFTGITISPKAWFLIGGESGIDRRYFDKTWAVNIYNAGHSVGVPCFFKQGSGERPGSDDVLPGLGKLREWPDV